MAGSFVPTEKPKADKSSSETIPRLFKCCYDNGEHGNREQYFDGFHDRLFSSYPTCSKFLAILAEFFRRLDKLGLILGDELLPELCAESDLLWRLIRRFPALEFRQLRVCPVQFTVYVHIREYARHNVAGQWNVCTNRK